MREPAPERGRTRLVLLLAAVGVLVGCEKSDAPDDDLRAAQAPEPPPVVSAEEALSSAHIPTVDPATMTEAEIIKVIGAGPNCRFRYTGGGAPVLGISLPPNRAAGEGVVKLNGRLVPLEAEATVGALLLHAGEVRLSLAPVGDEEPEDDEAREAELVFEVGESLRVGYRGYYGCVD